MSRTNLADISWDFLVSELNKKLRRQSEVLDVFLLRINHALFTLDADNISSIDRALISKFANEELPIMVDSILFSQAEDCIKVQHFLTITLKFVVAFLRTATFWNDSCITTTLFRVLNLIIGGFQGRGSTQSLVKSVDSAVSGKPTCLINGNFYAEYGRPLLRSYQGRNMYIWPDNLLALAVGDDSKGWLIEILDPFGSKFPGGTSGTPSWIRSEVLEKNPDPACRDEYLIRVFLQDFNDESMSEVVSVNLSLFSIKWLKKKEAVDSTTSQNSGYTYPSSFANAITGEDIDREKARLLHTYCDKDAEINVWLPEEFPFRAFVTSFHSDTGAHELKIRSPGSLEPAVRKLSMLGVKHEVLERKGKWVKVPMASSHTSTSLHQLRSLETFCSFDGFESLAMHLYYSNNPKAEEVMGTVDLIFHLWPLFDPLRHKRLAWTIKEAIPQALLKMSSDQLRQIRTEALYECVGKLSQLTRDYTSSSTVNSNIQTEQLKLGLALKLFRCSQLAKRLHGLKVILELVNQVSSPNTRSTLKKSLEQSSRSFLWADAHSTEKWLVNGGFVEELFGEGCHPELARISEPVLKFLAIRGVLTASHLEALWACSEGTHEASVKVLHDLALGIIPVLTPHLRRCLFSCAATSLFTRYSPQTLCFLRDITACSLRATRNSHSGIKSRQTGKGNIDAPPSQNEPPNTRPTNSELTFGYEACGLNPARKGQVVHYPEGSWFGFGVLLQFIMGDFPNNCSVSTSNRSLTVGTIEMASDLLISLFAEPEILPERGLLIARCIENLRSQRSVEPSLILLQRIISTFPISPSNWFDKMTLRTSSITKEFNSVPGVIDALQKDENVVHLIIDELQSYCQDSKNTKDVTTHRQLDSSTRSRAKDIFTNFSHLEHLQVRANFLLFILTRGNITLTEQQVVDFAMEWFQTACGGPASDENSGALGSVLEDSCSQSTAFSPLLNMYLFNVKLCELCSDGCVRPSTALLFMNLFVRVNWNLKLITKERAARSVFQSSSQLSSEIEDYCSVYSVWARLSIDLNGIDSLWKIAFNADNDEVSRRSCALLVNLHRRFGPKMSAAKVAKIKEQFIETCLERMSDLTSDTSISSSARKQQLIRCIHLLHSFFQWSGTMSFDEGPNGAISKITLNILFGMDQDNLFNMTVPKNILVADLFAEIAKFLEIPSSFELSYCANPNFTSAVHWKTLDKSSSDTLESIGLCSPVTLLMKPSRVDDEVVSSRSPLGELDVGTTTPSPFASKSPIEATKYEEIKEGFYSESIPSYWDILVPYIPRRSLEFHIVKKNYRSILQTALNLHHDVLIQTSSQLEGQQQKSKIKMRLANSTNILSGIYLSSRMFSQTDTGGSQNEAKKLASGMGSSSGSSGLGEEDISFLSPQGNRLQPHTFAYVTVPEWKSPISNKDRAALSVISSTMLSSSSRGTRSTFSTLIGLGNTKEPIDPNAEEADLMNKTFQMSLLGNGNNSSHLSQLFSMLEENFDCHDREDDEENLSAGVWRVLQALPINSELIEDVASLKKVKDSSHWTIFLDITSTYKLLYVLQIIDTFLSMPELDMNAAISEAVLKWASKFIKIGGANHLCLILSQIAEKLVTTRRTKKLSRELEPLALCSAYIFRSLHRLFQLENDYISVCGSLSRWEVARLHHSRNCTDIPSSDCQKESFDLGGLQAGVVVDAMSITEVFVKSNTPNEPLLSAVCHSMSLIAVSVTAFKISREAFVNSGRLFSWLNVLLLRSTDHSLRRIVASLLFRTCEVACATRENGVHAEESNIPKVLVTVLGHCISIFESLILIDPEVAERQLGSKSGGIVVPRAHTGEFLALLGGLLYLWFEIPERSREDNSFEARAVKEASNRLARHEFSESLMSKIVDVPLVGLLRLLIVLLRHNPALVQIAAETFTESSRQNQKMIHFLFNNCLCYPELTENCKERERELVDIDKEGFLMSPKCKTAESREAAFALAAQLVSIPSNREMLLDLLVLMGGCDPYQECKDDRRRLPDWTTLDNYEGSGLLWKWDYNPADLVKEGGQYGGLVNQGATCYLNSVLQQLFHIKKFSGPLMSIMLPRAEAKEECEEVLFKLQVLFASLQMGQRRYHDTRSFCAAFKDFNGLPIQLIEQKDAYEFYSMLMDKLEHSSPDASHLVKRTFGGTLQYQIVSTEPSCTHCSVRNEPFFILTAEVQSKNTLASALDLFTAGEALDGENKYMCESCGKRVAAQRRCAIGHLPPVLILHLKRFEFNLDTMTKKKLNHRFTFPMDLNMEPWTVEGIERQEFSASMQSGSATLDEQEVGEKPSRSVTYDEGLSPPLLSDDPNPQDSVQSAAEMHRRYTRNPSLHSKPSQHYQYQLKGVVAHSGTADSGHYYSYIRMEDGSWMEFNDRLVTPFDVSNIAKECFGGADIELKQEPIGAASQARLKNNSAYLLLYEWQFEGEQFDGSEVVLPNPAPTFESNIASSNPEGLIYDEIDSSIEELERMMEPTANEISRDNIILNDSENSSSGIGHSNNEDLLRLRAHRRKNPIGSIGGSVDWTAIMNRSEIKSSHQIKLTAEVMKALSDENASLSRDIHHFNISFLKFTWAVIGFAADASKNNSIFGVLALKIATQMAIEVVARSKMHFMTPQWFSRIEDMISSSSYLTESFFMLLSTSFEYHLSNVSKESSYWLNSMLVTCPHEYIKETVRSMICTSLSRLDGRSALNSTTLAASHSAMNSDSDAGLVSLKAPTTLKAGSKFILMALLNMLEHAPTRNRQNFRGPFSMLHILHILSVAAKLGRPARHYLIGNKAVGTMASVWSFGGRTALPMKMAIAKNPNEPAAKQVPKQDNDYHDLLRTIMLFIVKLIDDLPPEYSGHLSLEESQPMLDSSVLETAVKMMPESASTIITAMIQNEPPTSIIAGRVNNLLCCLCQSCIGTNSVESLAKLRPCLEVLSTVMHISDGHEAERLELIFSWFLHLVTQFLEQKKTGKNKGKPGQEQVELVQIACEMILSVSLHVPLCRPCILKNRMTWEGWLATVESALPKKVAPTLKAESSSKRQLFPFRKNSGAEKESKGEEVPATINKAEEGESAASSEAKP